MSSEAKVKIKPIAVQCHLPYSGGGNLQILPSVEKKVRTTGGEAEGGQEGDKGFFSFFVGASTLYGKLLYCQIPKSTDADVLARLSSSRWSDKAALAEVLAEARAEVWLLSRAMGARISATWSGPFSPTDDTVSAYLESGEDRGGVRLVENLCPFALSLPKP